MFVVYSNFEEVIVCLDATEEETIRVYFTEGHRAIEEYDRTTSKEEAVMISAAVRVN